MITMKNQKDYSVSCVRFVAMCFIVACHMMQRDDFASEISGAHISWAFWFNVGVQMFLFLSGYLYGRKQKIDTILFYKKNFPKLLVDYYVFVIVMLVIIHFSSLWDIDASAVVGLLTFSSTTNGLGHLWFIATILFCYLMTPIFLEMVNAIDRQNNFRFLIKVVGLLAIIHMIMEKFFDRFSPAWINCYMLGMIYRRIENKNKTYVHIFHIIITILVLIIIPVQFRIDYWPHEELTRYLAQIYVSLCNYGHVFLGIFLVVIIRFFYFKIGSRSNKHLILDWSDKYSYDIYLTHHVFVLSAFGCVEFIDNRMIALPLAVVLTIISAVILYYVSNIICELSQKLTLN